MSRLWWDMIVLCWRRHPGTTAFLLGWSAATTVTFALAGLLLRALVDTSQTGTAEAIVLAAVGASAALTANMAVGHIAYLKTVHLVERVSLTDVEPAILRACTGLSRLEHLEQPEFLDRVTALQGQAGSVVDSA